MVKTLMNKNGGMQFEIISLFPESVETASFVLKKKKERHQNIYQGKSQIYEPHDPYFKGKLSKRNGRLDPYCIPDEVA